MLLKPAGLAVAFALPAGCASDKGFHYAPPPPDPDRPGSRQRLDR